MRWNKKEIIIGFVIALLCVICVELFVFMFSRRSMEKEVSLNDPDVQNMYQYVQYGREGIETNLYLLSHPHVMLSNMPDEMIHYYAFQALSSSDVFIGKEEVSTYQYALKISKEAYDKAIETVFGSTIHVKRNQSYSWIPPVNYTKKNDIVNIGQLGFSYDKETNSYIGKKTIGPGNVVPILKPVYGSITKATKNKKEKTLTIHERFIVIDEAFDNGTYAYRIYQDGTLKKVLAKKSGLSEEEMKTFAKTISVKDFKEAGEIEYTFQLGDDNQYHFKESKLIKKK